MAECIKCRSFQFCPWATPPDIICSSFRPRTQTNADRIRSMSDEELAGFLEMIPHCGNPPTYTTDGFCIDDGLRTKRQWLDWLRQEATDG